MAMEIHSHEFSKLIIPEPMEVRLPVAVVAMEFVDIVRDLELARRVLIREFKHIVVEEFTKFLTLVC